MSPTASLFPKIISVRKKLNKNRVANVKAPISGAATEKLITAAPAITTPRGMQTRRSKILLPSTLAIEVMASPFRAFFILPKIRKVFICKR